MFHYQALVAKDSDARDGVHILGVQEADELGQVVDINLMLAEQRMLEGNGHAAIGIFDIEDDGVAANFAPVADDAESVVAGRHDSGQVDGADFKISGDGHGFFYDGRRKNSWNRDLLAVFQNVAGAGAIVFSVGAANGFGQLARRQICSSLQVLMSDCGNAFTALRGISLGGGQSWMLQSGNLRRFYGGGESCADWLKLRALGQGSGDGRRRLRGRRLRSRCLRGRCLRLCSGGLSGESRSKPWTQAHRGRAK